MSNYPIQKALHLADAKKVKKFKFSEYGVMEKIDGNYVYIDCVDGVWGCFRTSAHRELDSLRYLSKKIQGRPPISGYDNHRHIFEATIPGLEFHEANGVLNRRTEQAVGVILHLHDQVAFDMPENWFMGRYQGCKNVIDGFKDVLGDQVQLVPLLSESCTSEEHAQQLFQEVTARGGEGIILKDLSAGYHFGKRNNTLMKIKEEITRDLLVIDMVEGNGKYKGLLGALIVISRAGVRMEVSGMEDKDRVNWWQTPETIMGKVVEVKAKNELPNGMLREPRFKAIRWDKTAEDID